MATWGWLQKQANPKRTHVKMANFTEVNMLEGQKKKVYMQWQGVYMLKVKK